MGLQMGLYRPHHASEFVNESSIGGETEILRRRTWVVCFITNLRCALVAYGQTRVLTDASLNAQLGLPATIQLDHSLLEILAPKPKWLPDTLYRQLHISRQAFKISSTLGYDETRTTALIPGLPVIRTFETELRGLEYQFSLSWSPTEYIISLGSRIMLYTFALTLEPLENSDGIEIASPSHWLIQAYEASATIIQTASSIRDQLLRRCSSMPCVFFSC